jgi:hypothetical protein
MPRFQVARRASDNDIVIQAYGDSTISGHSNIGNFYHDGGGADVIHSDANGKLDDSHVVFHHVRDMLYPLGVMDMSRVKITYKRVTSIASDAADKAMDHTSDTTEQINTTFTPADAPNRGLTYESSNPAVLTVNATGLVTAVAAGTAKVTVTSTDTGVQSVVSFTVA